jgi:hypothetical protein
LSTGRLVRHPFVAGGQAVAVLAAFVAAFAAVSGALLRRRDVT